MFPEIIWSDASLLLVVGRDSGIMRVNRNLRAFFGLSFSCCTLVQLHWVEVIAGLPAVTQKMIENWFLPTFKITILVLSPYYFYFLCFCDR